MRTIRVRKAFLFKLILLSFSILLIDLSLIKILIQINEINLSKHRKIEDYFKPAVNWSEYPIVTKDKQNLILVLGEARSGTSFLADLLHQSWPTFYAFEPLFSMKDKNIRDDLANSQTALDKLARIFDCDFDNLKNYVLSLWKNENNIVLQKYPGINKTLYWNRTINKYVCNRCDNILIKSIRISVKQYLEIQQKLKKPIKLVYLVRDPRGVMSSRYLPKMDWCRDDSKCATPAILCQRVKSDLNELIKLSSISPGLISLIRYEDLATDIKVSTKGLFKNLRIDYNYIIEKWIVKHTNNNNHLGDPYSTTRHSKAVVFSWIKRLNSSQIMEIQEKCFEIMNILGYNLLNFNNNSLVLNGNENFKSADILSQKFKLDYLIPKK